MSEFVHIANLTTPEAPWKTTRKERIPAPPERVWKALTEPREIESWWCEEARVELSGAGGRYEFRGPSVFSRPGTLGETAHAGAFEILDCVNNERLAYRWWLGDVETVVTIQLLNLMEITEISVTQTAACEPAWKDAHRGPNWWWVALPALRSFVENGSADLRINYEATRNAPTIEFEVGIYTFPWIIWDKLTNTTQLERWWAENATIDLNPGGRFEFAGEGAGPRSVIEVEPGARLLHDWRWTDGTLGKIEWTIRETDDATAVAVRDQGPWDTELGRDFVAIHWASTLLHLKQMSQRGITPREYQA